MYPPWEREKDPRFRIPTADVTVLERKAGGRVLGFLGKVLSHYCPYVGRITVCCVGNPIEFHSHVLNRRTVVQTLLETPFETRHRKTFCDWWTGIRATYAWPNDC